MSDQTATTKDPLDGFVPKLDLKRPYFEVHGVPSEHMEYVQQDGFYFTAEFKFIPELVRPEQQAALVKAARKRAAIEQAERLIREAEGEDAAGDDRPRVKLIEPGEISLDDIDLVAWAADGGRSKIPFSKVSEKVGKTYGDKPTDKRSALEIIKHGTPVTPKA
jgi:hypothetical protein